MQEGCAYGVIHLLTADPWGALAIRSRRQQMARVRARMLAMAAPARPFSSSAGGCSWCACQANRRTTPGALVLMPRGITPHGRRRRRASGFIWAWCMRIGAICMGRAHRSRAGASKAESGLYPQQAAWPISQTPITAPASPPPVGALFPDKDRHLREMDGCMCLWADAKPWRH